MKGAFLFQGEIIKSSSEKTFDEILKSFSLEPLGQYQPNFGEKHPWVKRFKVCSYRRALFPKGDNNITAKINLQNLKISSSRTTVQILNLKSSPPEYLVNFMIYIHELCSNIFINFKRFLRWAIWPIGLLFVNIRMYNDGRQIEIKGGEGYSPCVLSSFHSKWV